MTVPLPRYAPSIIYSCAECWGDLEHAGATEYWCPACERTFYFAQVVLYDETDYDRD